MFKLTVLSAIFCLCFSVFAQEQKQIPRSLLCDAFAGDGKPIVTGLHNPYRMKGYILETLPVDKQADEVFRNYVLPAMTAACEAAHGNAYNVVLAGSDACRKGCKETQDFKYSSADLERMRIMCSNHCAKGDQFLYGVLAGAEIMAK